MKRLTLILLAVFAWNIWAGDLTSEMDALGANRELMKKARAIDPQNSMRIVQNREVDRRLRFEIGLDYGMVAGGDSYVNTSMLGAQLDFHINPQWSLGARYYNNSNTLSSEGKTMYDQAQQRQRAGDNSAVVPGIDSVKSTALGVINWYPIYGKMSIFEAGISQFDLYLLGGGGEVALNSGFHEAAVTAGIGVGVWLSQHFSTRLEARWEGYNDHPYRDNPTLKRDVNETILTASVGFLL